jgi:hypothetical protein
MFRKHAVLLVALLVATAYWVDGRLSGWSLTQPAQAQARAPEARKWEYRIILGVNWGNAGGNPSATIGIITPSGVRYETLDSPSADPLAFAFAKLGSEGWEFVGQVEYHSPSSEYRPNTWMFKRPAL